MGAGKLLTKGYWGRDWSMMDCSVLPCSSISLLGGFLFPQTTDYHPGPFSCHHQIYFCIIIWVICLWDGDTCPAGPQIKAPLMHYCKNIHENHYTLMSGTVRWLPRPLMSSILLTSHLERVHWKWLNPGPSFKSTTSKWVHKVLCLYDWRHKHWHLIK